MFGILVALATCLIDASRPVGVVVSMAYPVLPLLGLLARSPRTVIGMAALGTILTGIGILASPAGAPVATVLLNRGMSVVLTWIVGAIAIRHLSVGNRFRKRLRNQAAQDPLTGLYNRRHVFGVVNDELKRYQRYGEPFSLILIDADHFKRINDRHGHCAGDSGLRLIAKVCRNTVRETDVLGRFGGEEFIIVLPHTKVSEAQVVAQRICETMRRTGLNLRGGTVAITLSLGVAEVGPNVESFDELLKAADRALYKAKRDGRDRVATAGAGAPSTHGAEAA
ncbi:MAG: GGDEF domain-containing protein [Woeseiaceae bacterium]